MKEAKQEAPDAANDGFQRGKMDPALQEHKQAAKFPQDSMDSTDSTLTAVPAITNVQVCFCPLLDTLFCHLSTLKGTEPIKESPSPLEKWDEFCRANCMHWVLGWYPDTAAWPCQFLRRCLLECFCPRLLLLLFFFGTEKLHAPKYMQLGCLLQVFQS